MNLHVIITFLNCVYLNSDGDDDPKDEDFNIDLEDEAMRPSRKRTRKSASKKKSKSKSKSSKNSKSKKNQKEIKSTTTINDTSSAQDEDIFAGTRMTRSRKKSLSKILAEGGDDNSNDDDYNNNNVNDNYNDDQNYEQQQEIKAGMMSMMSKMTKCKI